MDELERICASQATVEVVDEGSGCIVRRTLPLDYEENDNGVKLAGEAMDGRESEIVFLSAQAIEKIQDLTGHGLNRARCGDHQ